MVEKTNDCPLSFRTRRNFLLENSFPTQDGKVRGECFPVGETAAVLQPMSSGKVKHDPLGSTITATFPKDKRYYCSIKIYN